FLKAAAHFNLSVISKDLRKRGYEITAKFPDDTKVISLGFLNKMKVIFGDGWEERTGWKDILSGEAKKQKYNIEDLWHLHFQKTDNKETGETSSDILKRFGIEKLNLGDSEAELFSGIRLQQGYATLSLCAINKILPFLRQGFIYSESIYLANLTKILGVNNLTDEIIHHFSEQIREII